MWRRPPVAILDIAATPGKELTDAGCIIPPVGPTRKPRLLFSVNPTTSKVQECANCASFGKVTYISGLIGIWHDCHVSRGVMEEHSWCTKWEEASEADLERINKELEDARKIQKKRG